MLKHILITTSGDISVCAKPTRDCITLALLYRKTALQSFDTMGRKCLRNHRYSRLKTNYLKSHNVNSAHPVLQIFIGDDGHLSSYDPSLITILCNMGQVRTKTLFTYCYKISFFILNSILLMSISVVLEFTA